MALLNIGLGIGKCILGDQLGGLGPRVQSLRVEGLETV